MDADMTIPVSTALTDDAEEWFLVEDTDPTSHDYLAEAITWHGQVFDLEFAEAFLDVHVEVPGREVDETLASMHDAIRWIAEQSGTVANLEALYHLDPNDSHIIARLLLEHNAMHLE